MAITNSLSKPSGPSYVLNGGSPQAQGLVYWAPLGMAGAVQDAVQHHTTPWTAGTSLIQTPNGLAWKCDANNLGGQFAAPAALQTLLPVTLMVVFWQSVAPTANGTYFGVSYATTDTTPFVQGNISVNGGGTGIQLAWNSAGTFANSAATAAFPANGALHVVIGVIANGRQQIYVDGVSSVSASVAISTPTSSNGVIGIGQATSDLTTRHCGSYILDCRMYNRALTTDEARSFTDQWTDLYAPPSFRWGKKAAAGGTFNPFWAVGASQLISGGYGA